MTAAQPRGGLVETVVDGLDMYGSLAARTGIGFAALLQKAPAAVSTD